MIDRETKNARLEARLPESVIRLLRPAAELQGRTLSDFVVNAAREAAERAIADHEMLRLSLSDQQQFAAQLLKPRKPNAAMKRALKRRSVWIEPS